MMGDLAAMHAGMQGHEQHDPMMTSMQGMLDTMKQLHGQLNGMTHDPSVMKNNEAMKGFQQACKNLEQMASSFQSMTKNVTTVMKATAATAKK
jgi:hypothetical protein